MADDNLEKLGSIFTRIANTLTNLNRVLNESNDRIGRILDAVRVESDRREREHEKLRAMIESVSTQQLLSGVQLAEARKQFDRELTPVHGVPLMSARDLSGSDNDTQKKIAAIMTTGKTLWPIFKAISPTLTFAALIGGLGAAVHYIVQIALHGIHQ